MKAHVYTGNLEYSGLMPNPGKWVKAEDHESEVKSLKESLDWCMMYYPFGESINPPLEIEEELRLSRQRNEIRFKSGFRR